MTEIKLDQIGFIKGRPRLRSSFPNDNLDLYMASDILPDETAQDVPSNEDEIEPAILY